MGITVKDLKSIIKDSVSGAIAEKMVSAEEEARGLFEQALKKGDPQFLAQLRGLVSGDARPVDRAAAARNYRVETDPLKGKGLAFARAARCVMLAKRAGGAVEAKDIARNLAEQGHQGYREVADAFGSYERALSAGSLSGAGVLIPETLSGEFIELLYAATVATRLGARDLEFNGSLALGRLNAGATVGYVGEEENVVPSQPSLGAVKLSGKKAAALVALTNELLGSASIGADAMVRDDLLNAMALRRDLSFYRGLGTDKQPKGVYHWLRSGQRANQSGTTLAAIVADYIGLCRLVAESNIPMDSAAFVMAPRTAWALAKQLDSSGNFVFMPMIMAGNLFGFRLGQTTQIPTNLSGSQSEVYFGVHSDVILGRDSARPLEIETQPNGAYWDGSAVRSGFSTDTTPIRILESHDVAARHDNSFAVLEQVTLS